MPEATAQDRDTAARITRTGLIAMVSAAALVLIWGSGRRDPLLVWNASASSPRGLYLFDYGDPRVGDFVLARPPRGAAELALSRRYLPAGVLLVKTVAAGPGERVCAVLGHVRIGQRTAVVRRRVDGAGRALPWWSGCRTLRPGEYFLLGRGDPGSFDGRYFGPVTRERIHGRLRVIWPA